MILKKNMSRLAFRLPDGPLSLPNSKYCTAKRLNEAKNRTSCHALLLDSLVYKIEQHGQTIKHNNRVLYVYPSVTPFSSFYPRRTGQGGWT